MLNIWTKKSGYTFGTIQEGSIVDLELPVTYDFILPDSSSATFKVISGSLPAGLRLVNDHIVGTPYEVPRTTEFTFCIRASYNTELADRTFKITIEGADVPVFTTTEGILPVGPNNTYFILDSSFVDFQINVTDNDTAAGQTLRYFIASGDGTLPPGLTLTDDGKITGLIEPAYTIVDSEVGNGYYSNDLYDVTGYDFGQRPDNGFDSFIFDSVFYDYFLPSLPPRKLNRNYEFIVSVSDSDTVSKRKFKIYVVGDDFLRADNTIARAADGVFTVDGTYLRNPVWLTPSDLGTYRANNYVTLVLDCYDSPELGPIIYSLDTLNPDNSPSVLPPGLQLDIPTSEVFGVVPYQPTITETYHFTVTATRYDADATIASTKRTFTIKTLGDVDSVMNWETGSSLGTIDANFISNLRVSATSNIEGATLVYSLEGGALPPGLTLGLDGEITGKVNQYGTINEPGITTFSDGVYTNQTFDGGTSSVDRTFKFVIKAQDQFKYSSISREFVLNIDTPNDRLYSSIVARTFMNQSKRALFNDFINDSNVFTATSVYRPNDPNFGIQRDLKMTVFGGIETKTAAEYVSAMGLNHKRKRFTFGNIKSAKAKITGTNTVVYEVVYVEMFDPLEISKKYLNSTLTRPLDPKTVTADTSNAIWRTSSRDEPFLPRPDSKITIDQTNIFASNPNHSTRYPSSISIWRDQILAVGDRERNYLPLWMRSIQDDSKQELGFVLAVPICFCKPGTSADIMLNIKFSGFDFKNLDYTVDRYIIDSVTGSGNDKYLVFKDDKVTIT
jgi:hypothetical protein